MWGLVNNSRLRLISGRRLLESATPIRYDEATE
jgi:hypothetical protein